MKTNCNVLFVDSEISVLESIKRMLMDKENMTTFFASEHDDVIDKINNNDIDTLFVDITNNNFVRILEEVQQLKPNIVKVVISDYAHLSSIINSIRKLNIHSLLLKPWKKSELLEMISSADDYSKYLKAQAVEKENLAQKNVIYERILNFKDDLGETNKADITALKTSMFVLSSEYEKIIRNPEGIDVDLSIRALYNASEIFVSAFPTFIEKFTVNDLVKNMALSYFATSDSTGGKEFAKNLTLIRETLSRLQKFLTSFMGTSMTDVNFSTNENDALIINVNSNFDQSKKSTLHTFCSYLKLIYASNNVTIDYNIKDEGTLSLSFTL